MISKTRNAVIFTYVERKSGTCDKNKHGVTQHRVNFWTNAYTRTCHESIVLDGPRVKWWKVGLREKVKEQIKNTRDGITVCKSEVEDRVGRHELRDWALELICLLFPEQHWTLVCLFFSHIQRIFPLYCNFSYKSGSSIHVPRSCDINLLFMCQDSVFCIWEMCAWSRPTAPSITGEM